MNEFYKIESGIVFKTVQKKLSHAVKNKNPIEKINLLKTSLEKKLSSPDRPIVIEIYDLLNRSLISSDHDSTPWSFVDNQTAEKSLLEKKRAVPYLVQVDKKTKSLFAYIPLQSSRETNQIWVARVLFPLTHIEDALRDSRWSLFLMTFFILLAGLFIGRGFANTIVRPIQTLNTATQEILQGHLGRHVVISTGDEIEVLAHTFNHMSESLMLMKQRAEDANPLTGLPGNQGIFDEIKRRIHEKQKFVVFHADLDRFKSFNDYYGLARGDEVLKQTAVLLREAILTKGSKTDFIGHQGGDDFILVVNQHHAKEVAEYVTSNFETRLVKAFYRKEDYERGYMVGIDRRAELTGETARPAQIPLMAISLAGVSNAEKDFADYFDCLGRAVNVKTEAKKIPGSCYIIRE